MKSLNLFCKNKKSKDGHYGQCKDCVNLKNRNKWVTDPFYADKVREKNRKNHHANKELRSKSSLEWYTNNKETRLNTIKQYRLNIKEKIFQFYGNHCAVCGENIIEFLTIDHINNDANLEQCPNSRRGGTGMWNIALKAANLGRYQVLCFNCNIKKSIKLPKFIVGPEIGKSRICVDCGKNHDLSLFSLSGINNNRRPECKYCSSERNKKTKLKCFNIFGNRCNCCFIDDVDKLSLDHINNDGATRRKQGDGSGANLYSKILRNEKFIPLFQLLCHNCNSSKHFGNGICVHKRMDFLKVGS